MRTSMLLENERRSYVPSRAFTIIELLVVLGIMGVLAAMTVFAMGPLNDRSAVSGGGAVLQTWLNTARQRAIRDKTQSGIRFLPGNSLPAQNANNGQPFNAYYVTRMIYLEGGAELFGTLYTDTSVANTFNKFVVTPPLPGNLNPAMNSSSNDTIIINTGLPHPISDAPIDTTQNPPVIPKLTLLNNWPYVIPSSAPLPYRIVRAPNVVTAATDSENILQMPRGSCVNFDPTTTMMLYSGPGNTGNPPIYPGGIDLGNYAVSNNSTVNYVPKANFTTANGLDIMFAPDGTVLTVGGQAPPNNPIVFWVSSTAAVSPANNSLTGTGANQTITGPTPGPRSSSSTRCAAIPGSSCSIPRPARSSVTTSRPNRSRSLPAARTTERTP